MGEKIGKFEDLEVWKEGMRKGSCSELRTQIYLAVEIGVFDKATGDELLESTKKISAMLHNFIKVRKERF